MIFFITVLRALAACLITNSHYTGVYPTDIIANGGLLGDVIFFAVSGFCLFNVRQAFPAWYGKRIARVYLPVLIATVIYFALGFYAFGGNQGFLWWFVYPTGYHFVGSIVLLYIPFWFVGKIEKLRNNLGWLMVAVGVIYLAVYIFLYDKSYYHIDNVREWMIRFLFFESMLLGAYFKKNQEKYQNKFHWWLPIVTIGMSVVYFASKLLFSRYASYSSLQIINQFLIFALLFFIFWLLASLDAKLENMPMIFKKIISFIAAMTLEIYVVQSVLIELIRPYLSFPLNWLAITSSIVAAAFVLHIVCQYILKGIDLCCKKLSGKFIQKGKE